MPWIPTIIEGNSRSHLQQLWTTLWGKAVEGQAKARAQQLTEAQINTCLTTIHKTTLSSRRTSGGLPRSKRRTIVCGTSKSSAITKNSLTACLRRARRAPPSALAFRSGPTPPLPAASINTSFSYRPP